MAAIMVFSYFEVRAAGGAGSFENASGLALRPAPCARCHPSDSAFFASATRWAFAAVMSACFSVMPRADFFSASFVVTVVTALPSALRVASNVMVLPPACNVITEVLGPVVVVTVVFSMCASPAYIDTTHIIVKTSIREVGDESKRQCVTIFYFGSAAQVLAGLRFHPPGTSGRPCRIVPSEVRVSRRTISEALVKQFFALHGVGCKPVPTRPGQRTPDFILELAQPVVCEVKQIEPNKEDLAPFANPSTLGELGSSEPRAKGRRVPNRFRAVLKGISPQLRGASKDGTSTLLVVYDATPFQLYSDDTDIMQAMFGHLSVDVWEDATGAIQHSEPYFGGKRAMTPTTNTSVSAVGILRGGPEPSTLSLTIFHNPFARVPLNPSLFDGLPVEHKK